jgi:hypothetical protein
MATLLSPGVYIKEIDASAIVPNVAANVAFLAGDFNAGPVDQPYIVTNKQEYEDIFGTPTDRNYNTWFQGYKFFDYANQLIVSRAFMEAPDDLTSPIGNPEAVFTVDGSINPNAEGEILEDRFNHNKQAEAVTDLAGSGTPGVWFYINKSNNGGIDPDPNAVEIGDEIHVQNVEVEDSSGNPILNYRFRVSVVEQNPNDGSWTSPIDNTTSSFRIGCSFTAGETLTSDDTGVTPFIQEYVSITLNPDNPNESYISFNIKESFDYELKIGDWVSLGNIQEIFKIYSIQNDKTNSGKITISCVRPNPAQNPDPILSLLNPVLFLHSIGHHNAGTQAYIRGELEIDPTTLKVYPAEKTWASDSRNVDGEASANGNISDNRLSYAYDLIKNQEDFDYKLEQNDPSMMSFMQGMKLKFYGRNPVESDVEIAIANWYDFQTDSKNQNHAIAFETTVGVQKEYTYLTTLFDYAPLKGSTVLDDELAIAIKYKDTIETFICSLDPLSVDGNGKNNYIETVINENSKLVFVVDNKGLEDAPSSYLVVDKDGFNDDGSNVSPVQTTVLKIVGGRNPQNDEGGIRDAYFSVEDKEKYEIDVVIGNERFPNIGIELADSRKDCIAYVGARYEDTVGKKAIDATNAILNYMKTGELTRTMFAADFVNYFRVYDKYNKKYRWINVAGDMAGIRCDVTSNHDAWWVSAGMRRGIIRNINKLAFTPSQAQRDNLYKAGVNPIVQFPGTGNLVWGNKTLHPIASSFDRINVRTLFNTLERSMAKAARSQVFEFNDPYTRNAMLSMFNPYLSTIKAGRGITDYLVVCDSTNNTPDVISRNELRVDIYIKPNYAAEMILLTFTNVGTRSFSDVVGV